VSGPPFEVSHIVFDIDGTLTDYRAAIFAGLEAVAGHLRERADGIDLTVDDLGVLRNGVVADPAWHDRTLQEIRRESFRRVLEAFGNPEGVTVDAVAEVYYRTRDATMVVFPEVETTLDVLRDRGFTLTTASNGTFPLARVGLDRYFSAMQYSRDIGVRKPDPGFFRRAAEQGGSDPARTLAVGDRYDNDYEPALAAGLHAVLVDRFDRSEGLDVVSVGTLDGILPMVSLAS
jgi:putative hydrolase of the HAD superfamily